MSRDATLYVDDMIDACRRVLQYSDGLGRAQLVSGTLAHDAVLRNLEVLGEAVRWPWRVTPAQWHASISAFDTITSHWVVKKYVARTTPERAFSAPFALRVWVAPPQTLPLLYPVLQAA